MHRRSIQTRLIVAVLSAIAAHMPTIAFSAPSFDCAKASTAAERLICDVDMDWTLAARDDELATVYRRVLTGAGSRRKDLVAAQSQWIRERDAACMQPQKSQGEQRQCMAEKYDERIRALKPMQAGVKESLALCNGLVDRYKAALDTAQGKDQPHAGILETLKKTADAGFEIAESTDLASNTSTDRPTAEDYIKQHFNPDAALLKALREGSEDGGELVGSDAVWLTRLPKTDVYGVSTLNGSMRCESIDLLLNAGPAAATEIAVPTDQSECAGSYFAAIGDQPALISQEFIGDITPKTYHLVEGRSISPWKDGWLPACNISLTYQPHMSYPGRPDASGFDAAGESCPPGDSACVDLREAVLTVMKRYKLDPEQEPTKLVAELSVQHRQHFQVLKAASDAQASPKADNAWETGNYVSLPLDASGNDAIALNYRPVALPLVHNGKVMLVLAGHQMTTGSRDLPDYDVWVKAMDGAKATLVTSFTVTLSYGALQAANVSIP